MGSMLQISNTFMPASPCVCILFLLPPDASSGVLIAALSEGRTWQALMLASFFNLEGDLYYELFSGWMGKGDKESFAHALAATHTPYHLVSTPTGSIGVPLLVSLSPCPSAGDACRAPVLLVLPSRALDLSGQA